jgi:glycine/D-amino acid oxidase-like deaminating enzyme
MKASTKLRLGTSYWLDRYTGRAPRFGTMRGRHQADIAVVGGGVTGCVAACLFARAGARVVLVEARRIGRGSTAASTALLMQEPDVDLRDLTARYGAATARRIWMRSRGSLRGFIDLLRQLRISAGLQLTPSVYWTCDRRGSADLRRELARRHAAGIPGRWLSPAALKRTTGIDGAGGILTRGNAQVDPYRSCVGIAQSARDSGARLFEHATVLRMTGRPGGVDIELEHGAIQADWAIVATGYATPEFKPLAGRFKMMNTYVIATPALPRRARRDMGLGQVMLWDTGRPYHYARWTPDRRLLFGGQDRPKLPRAARPDVLDRRAESLSAELAELYPVLTGVTPDYAWEGLFATTPDGLPYIGAHRRYPRQLFALGYGGNGMTFGHLAAEILVRAARGTPAPDDGLFGFPRLTS